MKKWINISIYDQPQRILSRKKQLKRNRRMQQRYRETFSTSARQHLGRIQRLKQPVTITHVHSLEDQIAERLTAKGKAQERSLDEGIIHKVPEGNQPDADTLGDAHMDQS